MFHWRFDPVLADRNEAALHAEWGRLLDRIGNPDEDRILSRLRRNPGRDRKHMVAAIARGG